MCLGWCDISKKLELVQSNDKLKRLVFKALPVNEIKKQWEEIPLTLESHPGKALVNNGKSEVVDKLRRRK